MGNGKWEVGSGKWEVGSGKWEVGSGKWEVGSGKWKFIIYRVRIISYGLNIILSGNDFAMLLELILPWVFSGLLALLVIINLWCINVLLYHTPPQVATKFIFFRLPYCIIGITVYVVHFGAALSLYFLRKAIEGPAACYISSTFWNTSTVVGVLLALRKQTLTLSDSYYLSFARMQYRSGQDFSSSQLPPAT